MTERELMYIEDALGHLEFLKTQSQNAANSLQDGVLRSRAQEINRRSATIFDRFYGLV